MNFAVECCPFHPSFISTQADNQTATPTSTQTFSGSQTLASSTRLPPLTSSFPSAPSSSAFHSPPELPIEAVFEIFAPLRLFLKRADLYLSLAVCPLSFSPLLQLPALFFEFSLSSPFIFFFFVFLLLPFSGIKMPTKICFGKSGSIQISLFVSYSPYSYSLLLLLLLLLLLSPFFRKSKTASKRS